MCVAYDGPLDDHAEQHDEWSETPCCRGRELIQQARTVATAVADDAAQEDADSLFALNV